MKFTPWNFTKLEGLLLILNVSKNCLKYRILNLENLFEGTFEMKGAKVTKDLKATTVKGLLDKGLTMTVLAVL